MKINGFSTAENLVLSVFDERPSCNMAELNAELAERGVFFSNAALKSMMSRMSLVGRVTRYGKGVYGIPGALEHTPGYSVKLPIHDWAANALLEAYPGCHTASSLWKLYKNQYHARMRQDTLEEVLRTLVMRGRAVAVGRGRYEYDHTWIKPEAEPTAKQPEPDIFA